LRIERRLCQMANSDKVPLILLPGGMMPGLLRYPRLIEALGPGVEAVIKELEVYAGPSIPEGYSVDMEVEGISRRADEAEMATFHLYGYSGGGAVALAYVANHPERVLSLAIDEPATDFSEEQTSATAALAERMSQLSEEAGMEEFVRFSLRPGVDLPPPEGPPPAWMANRSAGLGAMMSAFLDDQVRQENWRTYEGTVYYSYGSLSAAAWEQMLNRLARLFPHFTSEVYEGLHGFNPSHLAEPERVAAALRKIW
jgi:pimeloyl-ACP methyl ester carboxylesterase